MYGKMSQMKRYEVRPPAPKEVYEALALYPEFIRDLLFARGITTIENADRFLNLSYDDHTHNPFLIAGMKEAVQRIVKAIIDNERIVIYSDYDHDGIPGGVILHDFFKKIGYKNFSNYIPHRYAEGYGLNQKAVEKLFEEGATLIITVDCGINDVLPVQRANELGVDVIITDHHLTQEILPPAFVILNSKQDHCDYPNEMLCGAAVAFKLVQALLRFPYGEVSDSKQKTLAEHFGVSSGWEKWLLDLVGISTIADMVPLVGENRVLARYGLTVLQKTRRPGLQKLLSRMNIRQNNITEDDIGFMIAPRINAASRMGDPRLAFDLLSSVDEDGKSGALASELEKLNNERKGVVASMVKEMRHALSEREKILDVVVIGRPSWRPGLLGLAANNILEEHNRPVFLWGREGGETLKGSCRSDGSVNLLELMQAVPKGIFGEFGGHAVSGGFSVHPEKIHYLEDCIIEAYQKTKKELESKEVLVDKKISVSDVDWPLWDMISLLAPFGVENPKPLFLLEGEVVKSVRKFGKKEEHTEILFEKGKGTPIKAISFFSAGLGREVKEGEKINLVANLEKSFFGYRPELRLRIVELL